MSLEDEQEQDQEQEQDEKEEEEEEEEEEEDPMDPGWLCFAFSAGKRCSFFFFFQKIQYQ